MIEDGSPKAQIDFPMAENDLRIALKTFEQGILRSLQICFPACVYSYDRSTHTATVMPLIKQGFYNGKWAYIRRKPFDVSVRNIQCGGFTIDFPLYVGDTGWVFSSDRDTLLIKQEGALTNSVLEGNRSISIVEDDYQQRPNQTLLHDFASGFFIPDNWGPWNEYKYKDNPQAAVKTGLYIGSSIDTSDNRDDVPPNKYYQKGGKYEEKSTASLVLNSTAGASIASSTAKSLNKNSHVTSADGEVEIYAEDANSNKTSAASISADSGITIRQDDYPKKSHFMCNIKDGTFMLRMAEEGQMMTFYYKDGKLNMTTTGDMGMVVGGDTNFHCGGKTNIFGAGDMNITGTGNMTANITGNASLSAKDAKVIANGDASVSANTVSAAAATTANINSGGTVNIGSAETTNINAGNAINLAAGKSINLTAPDSVNIVTASNVSVIAKKKEAQVTLKTMSKDSKIDVVMEGKGSSLNVEMQKKESSLGVTLMEKDSSVAVTTKGEKSPITISAEGQKSPIDIKTSGNSSDVTVKATGNSSNVKIQAYNSVEMKASHKEVNITANTSANINATEKATVTSKDITLTGDVAISGSLKLNNKPFKEKTHVIDKDHNAEYWSWGAS